jgi:hypothetical protein
MTTEPKINSTLQFYPKSSAFRRNFALWQFTVFITLWNILGHTWLGFEQSWIQPLLSVGTAVAIQFLLEWLDAWGNGRTPRFMTSWVEAINLAPPAIISGLATAMMLYPNERLWPVMFAAAVAICSKVLFRAPIGGGRTQHIFNPSNIGISSTLVLMPWIGLAPPYHYTENLIGLWHWLVPSVIICLGSFLHYRFTGRLPLIVAWIVGYALQGTLRSWFLGSPWLAEVSAMTSAAFVLFTLYMIPDPATTPLKFWRQIGFGFMVAGMYGLLLTFHCVFGLFLALTFSAALRGVTLYLIAGWQAFMAHRSGGVSMQPVALVKPASV